MKFTVFAPSRRSPSHSYDELTDVAAIVVVVVDVAVVAVDASVETDDDRFTRFAATALDDSSLSCARKSVLLPPAGCMPVAALCASKVEAAVVAKL